MPFGLAWADAAGLAAGVLIVGVGAFVLVARPHAPLNRLFFVLALTDGASTILFRLAVLPAPLPTRLYFLGTYFYHFLAFVALLAVFGLVFPRPLRSRRLRVASLSVVGMTAIGLLAAFALDHALFWTPNPAGAIPATNQPLGNLVTVLFVGVIALLVVRLTLALGRETSESHRRQAAYVLGGMALAYLPAPWTVTAQTLATRGLSAYASGRWDSVLTLWAFAAASLAMIASGVLLHARALPADARDERRFVTACYAGVIALAAVAFLSPSPAVGMTLRTVALLAYPVLLGYAIARYEVFDIDAKLRRAATVTLAASGLTLAFVLVETAAENVLQARLFAGVRSGFVSGTAAALVAAIAIVPVTRVSRRVASRVLPELSQDELHQRKIDIYRHSVAGAMADGLLAEGESRTLAALRASLGISDAEHARVLAEVAA